MPDNASSLLLKSLLDSHGCLRPSSLKISPSSQSSTINLSSKSLTINLSYELKRKYCLAKIINSNNNHIKHIFDLRKCPNVLAETGKNSTTSPNLPSRQEHQQFMFSQHRDLPILPTWQLPFCRQDGRMAELTENNSATYTNDMMALYKSQKGTHCVGPGTFTSRNTCLFKLYSRSDFLISSL